MAYQLGSGSGKEKTFQDTIEGFDSGRHRVMLVAMVLMKSTLVAMIGSLPASLLLSFFLKTRRRELRICSNYSIFIC